MFRPRASITYSSAMSTMRTQALPKLCSTSGTSSSAMPQTMNAISLFFCVMFSPCQARSATRSPNRPEGRSVSTMISTMKAKMSVYWLPSRPPVSVPM